MSDVRHRSGLLCVVVLIGHLVLVSAQVDTRGGQTVLASVVFAVFGEVQRVVAGAVNGVAGGWRRWVALRGVESENAELRARVMALEVELQQQRVQALRGERLEGLLALQRAMPLRTLAAEVIAGDATAWFSTIAINRGRADRVTADLAVVSPKGVVGRVLGRPSTHAARVQLLVDRNAAAGALVERSRTGGVVVGEEGDGRLRMDFVSNLADVVVGDVVVTSGVDGIYPKGLVIGEVVDVERGQGLYKVIHVTPSVDFSSIEEVLVVLDPPPRLPSDEGAS
jgi:rod shape-determining protein MreC